MAEYEEGRIEAQKKIEDGERQITEAREELAKAQQKIDDLEKPKWYVYDRNNLTEYSGYGDNADRMRAIGKCSHSFLPCCSIDQSDNNDTNGRGRENADRYFEGSRIWKCFNCWKYLWYAYPCDINRVVFSEF